MKRMISILLLFLLFVIPVFGAEPSVAAQGAALIDGKTGRLLWGKNADHAMSMASTTKIMTAILVLENADADDIVVITENAAHQPEVHMGLQKGDRWKAGDLLSAMMLRSYNDAAVALAEHVSGSVEAFCKEMTEKALSIGAEKTVFGSPNGLDSYLTDEEHHSTAYDMALIAAYALENEAFRKLIAQKDVNITELSGKHTYHVTNADRFLREYEGALGVKTGYTNKAGHCFVGAAERDDVLLISAVLGSGWGTHGKEQKWKDTKTLMDHGFANYRLYEIAEEGMVCETVEVSDSPIKRMETVLTKGYAALFSEEEVKKMRIECDLPEEVRAPVYQRQKLGTAMLFLEDEKLTEITLIAKEDAYRFTLSERLRKLAENWIVWRKF